MGEMLEEMEQTGQRDQGKGGDRKSRFHDGTVIPPTLSALGISKDLSHRCQLAGEYGVARCYPAKSPGPRARGTGCASSDAQPFFRCARPFS